MTSTLNLEDRFSAESPRTGLIDRVRNSRILKRLGFFGFMFFLVKGLLWLVVPAIFAYLATGQ